MKTHGFCIDVFFTAAMDWIKCVKGEDRPFFAYIVTNAPHGPFIAPPENVRRFTDLGFGQRQAGFYGMIENIDHNVGRLMGRLKAWNLLPNTLIIFMSDNGMTGNGAGRGVLGQTPDGKKDPGQTVNVIDEHTEVVKRMRAAYDAWWKETRPLMVNEDAAMSPTRPFHELYRKQMETIGIPEWKPPAI